VDFDPGRGRTSGQGVLKQVAKGLLQTETIPGQNTPLNYFPEFPWLLLAQVVEVGPRLPPDVAEVQDFTLERERGRVTMQVLKQACQASLGVSRAADEVQKLGPVGKLRGQYFQIAHGLLQEVAPFVCEDCGHLADACQPLRLLRPSLGFLYPGVGVVFEHQDFVGQLRGHGILLFNLSPSAWSGSPLLAGGSPALMDGSRDVLRPPSLLSCCVPPFDPSSLPPGAQHTWLGQSPCRRRGQTSLA
jgi:hypothetical protein